MPRTRLQPSALPDPIRYSHGFRVGNTVYLAGALGTEADGSMAPDIRTQTRRALEKLATVMHEAGGTLTDIVKLTVFITDMRWREGSARRRPFRPGSVAVLTRGWPVSGREFLHSVIASIRDVDAPLTVNRQALG